MTLENNKIQITLIGPIEINQEIEGYFCTKYFPTYHKTDWQSYEYFKTYREMRFSDLIIFTSDNSALENHIISCRIFLSDLYKLMKDRVAYEKKGPANFIFIYSKTFFLPNTPPEIFIQKPNLEDLVRKIQKYILNIEKSDNHERGPMGWV